MHGDAVGGPIRWRLDVPAAPEKVFAALDTDEGRASFWAEPAVETDGHVEFRFSNGYAVRSRILEREAPRLLSLDYFGSPARFELMTDGRATGLFQEVVGLASDIYAPKYALPASATGSLG